MIPKQLAMSFISKSIAIALSIVAMRSALAGDMPALPLKSADGCFVATASEGNLAARATVLDFAGDIRTGLRKITGWEMKPCFKPILIALDCGDVKGIRHRVFLSRDGGIRAQIEIAPMADIDAALLAREVVSVLARIELARNTEPGHTPTDFPDWFLAGLARQLDMSARQPDFEFTWSRWSHGRLESALSLCERDSISPSEEALSSQFVAWLLDRPRSKDACAELLRRMGDGEEWRPELIASCFAQDRDLANFDESWDAWMLDRGHVVLEPGMTTPGSVRRFRSQLLINPRDFGIPYCDFENGSITLEQLVALGDSPRVRGMAARRARAILASVVGRDQALRETATLFAGALDAVARGDAAAADTALLAARRRQRMIEAAAAAGKTLGARSRADSETTGE